MKPLSLARILTVVIGLGLAATACSSPAITSGSPVSPAATVASSPPPVTPFLGQLHGLTQLAKTVPANGDVNPYGVVVVSASGGRLTAGDILVSNFNDKANAQGTGTTFTQISPAGKISVFASISGER